MNDIAAELGEVGLPEPVKRLAARNWDAIVVGNAAAAALADTGSALPALEAARPGG